MQATLSAPINAGVMNVDGYEGTELVEADPVSRFALEGRGLSAHVAREPVHERLSRAIEFCRS